MCSSLTVIDVYSRDSYVFGLWGPTFPLLIQEHRMFAFQDAPFGAFKSRLCVVPSFTKSNYACENNRSRWLLKKQKKKKNFLHATDWSVSPTVY